VRKERSWRERNNLPRVKRHLSPCDTTKGRCERYARKRAEQLGISFDEAMARIKVRPQTTRYGRMKAAKEEGGLAGGAYPEGRQAEWLAGHSRTRDTRT
jgi:hypothetical protein